MGRDSIAATGHLRADRARDFAVLVSRLAPGEWSRILVDRAGELSPAALTFEAHGGAGGGDAPAINSLRANGSAGETQFTIALDPLPKDGGRALTVSLDSPNSGALLRQLGLRAAPAGSGRGHIALNAAGGWAQGYDVDATSSLAGSELTWRGRFLPQAEGDDAKLFGAAKVKTPNLAPIAAALGLAPANGGALGPADVGFDATLRGDRWTFSKLAATIAGVKASGELTYDPVATLSPAAQASAAISSAEEALGSGAGAARSPLVSVGGDRRRACRRPPADGRHFGARAWAAPAGQDGIALVGGEIRPRAAAPAVHRRQAQGRNARPHRRSLGARLRGHAALRQGPARSRRPQDADRGRRRLTAMRRSVATATRRR